MSLTTEKNTHLKHNKRYRLRKAWRKEEGYPQKRINFYGFDIQFYHGNKLIVVRRSASSDWDEHRIQARILA